MAKKLSPVYRQNQGPDPNYSSPLAQIAKDLDEKSPYSKRGTPNVKTRNYGGEDLQIRKSKEGIFKKPEFFLIGGDYYDPESDTKFVGESTTPIKGPTKRAIKGKGKRKSEAYVEISTNFDRPTHADGFAAMENIKHR